MTCKVLHLPYLTITLACAGSGRLMSPRIERSSEIHINMGSMSLYLTPS